MVFVVSTFDGEDQYFKHKQHAEKFAENECKRLHQKYCIEKWTPTECLCTRNEEKECAHHYYARTVKEHSVGHCERAETVWVEEKEVH